MSRAVLLRRGLTAAAALALTVPLGSGFPCPGRSGRHGRHGRDARGRVGSVRRLRRLRLRHLRRPARLRPARRAHLAGRHPAAGDDQQAPDRLAFREQRRPRQLRAGLRPRRCHAALFSSRGAGPLRRHRLRPRGVGPEHAGSVLCQPRPARRFFGSRPGLPVSAARSARLHADSSAIGRPAADTTATCSTHMSTANVARDLDLLRQAVGDEQLDLRRLLLWRLARHHLRQPVPRQVRALVLDGMVTPAERAHGP